VIDRSSRLTARGRRFDATGEVRAALRLLTRFRMSAADVTGETEATGAVAFPLVGALVGIIGAVPLVLLGSIEPLVAGLLALALIAVVTGALHLDGLADTADALLAPDAMRAERARKDPSVGAGGVVTLVLVIGLEASALAAIATAAGSWIAGGALVVAAVSGRTMSVVAVVAERWRTAPQGFGAWFAARVRPAAAVTATVLAIAIGAAVALATSSAAIAIGGSVGAAAGLLLARLLVAWRRQLDGDGMGAIVELTVAAVLIATAVTVAAAAS
jgi:adenosylcobinamide-GDP ribazoletransferase